MFSHGKLVCTPSQYINSQITVLPELKSHLKNKSLLRYNISLVTAPNEYLIQRLGQWVTNRGLENAGVIGLFEIYLHMYLSLLTGKYV